MTVLQRSTARLSSSSFPTAHGGSSSSSNNLLLTTSLFHACRRPSTHHSSTQQQQQTAASGCFQTTQTRGIRLLQRPRRPYTFTQLVTLSDGSAFLQRTTSPEPLYRSTRDARNTLLWNPSSEKLQNVEADEAGRLRAFRERFGRGWDARDGAGADVAREHGELEAGYEGAEDEGGDLMDLLTDFAGGQQQQQQQQGQQGQAQAQASAVKKKGGK